MRPRKVARAETPGGGSAMGRGPGPAVPVQGLGGFVDCSEP